MLGLRLWEKAVEFVENSGENQASFSGVDRVVAKGGRSEVQPG